MAVATKISREEYLATEFDRACPDWIDGELLERDAPRPSHQWIEITGGKLLSACGLCSLNELHLDMPDGLRVADVAAYREWPRDDYPDHPPLVTLEIASDSNRWNDTVDKAAAHWDWGVRHVWLFQPHRRALYVFDQAGLHQVQVFEIPELNLRITAADLLAGLPN
ncbi:MAG: Uma2 family endonuclease [Bryobacteraceae bacterium]|nr:Uma2 family endonuclease [Bryobacteraceae bacterium]